MNQKPQSSPAQQSSKPQAGPRPENRDATTHGIQPGSREDARASTTDARQLASDVAGQVTKSAERQLTNGKERAAEAIGHFAEALRETSGQLGAKEMPVVEDYLGRAASQVESVARYLQRKKLGQVVGDLESFARREPILFVGSALVVGLLSGRFLKSSAPVTEARGSGR